MKTAPVLTTPVEDVAAPAAPAVKVSCHCPRPCWANKATLDLVASDGYEPEFYCLQCAPEPMRSSGRFIIENRKALGIEEGTPIRVDVEEVEREPSPSRHGGNLN